MDLRHLGEFGLIARIRQRAARRCPQVLLGIGGDAAAFRPSEGFVLLATTDLLLEGIHFLRGLPSHHLLGKKALAVNISDIAAMGGIPRLALISLALSSQETVENIDALYAGMEEEASEYGVSIVGGDTSLSPGPLFLNVVLLGEAREDHWISRSGAKAGDTLMVTGFLGGSAAGLEVVRAGGERDPEAIRGRPARFWRRFQELDLSRQEGLEEAVGLHFLPVPRVREGQLLAQKGWAGAMIDISDGLASDLTHLCEESGVGAVIWERELPIAPCVAVVARELGKDPLRLATEGGEDYELLFATSAPAEVEKAFRAANLAPVTRIGEVLADSDQVNLLRPDGTLVPMAGGFDHFRPQPD
jgi:thiamine-monophosphate kinase